MTPEPFLIEKPPDYEFIHLCLCNVEFQCPYCGDGYNDESEKYLKKINKNKHYITKIKCNCGAKFGLTYDMKGDAVAFKLKD
jgi:hypothetical protein